MGYLIGGRLVSGSGLDAGQVTVRAVIPSKSSVELVMNDAGSLDVDVALPLVDPDTGAAIDLPSMLVPGRDFLGWVEGDTIIECGPIWGDPFAAPHTSRLIAEGLWSYFDRRVILPSSMASVPDRLPRDVTTRWTDLSLGTIAKKIVQQACAWPDAGLPINYLPDVAGTHEREYLGSDLKWVGDALRDLTEVQNGPEITFRPRWGADKKHVQWDMLTGDPEVAQAGAPHYLDLSVLRPYGQWTGLERDGRELATHSYTTGVTVRNEVDDPSFENADASWEPGSAGGAINAATGSALHGSKYGRLVTNGTGWFYISPRRSTSTEPGDRFRVSAYVRASNALDMRCALRFYDKDGDEVSTEFGGSSTAPTTSTWLRISTVAIAPAGASTVKLYVGGNATASGQVLAFDAVMLQRDVTELVPFAVDEIELQARATSVLLTAAGFPMLDATDYRDSVMRSDTLQAYSDESVLRGSTHTELVTFKIDRDKPPVLGTYWPGDYVTLVMPKNPRTAKGRRTARIARIAFTGSGQVDVECTPERIASGYPVPSSNRNWLRDKLRSVHTRIDRLNRRK